MDGSVYAAFIGRTVKVKICDSSEFRGTSVAIDAYLNISLESASYLQDGQEPRYYSSLFIKGSYIDHIALDA
ncbi:U6-snRNA ASSOCIATED SMALL NUCLEAR RIBONUCLEOPROTEIN [Encephalitozoon cuniculi GB-M1]|uniref:U6-snRNA ASSOCIATED SMALL NUCLEAR RIBONUCLEOPROTEIN n=2 Tax=Encephalitozoon cuniculi TaxID=6035 RepID=Q8SRP0_ENCCU|nr:small nuclear ribonucleoprotein [Encephalitozoon cuniculi GB-M1]AGE95777.1 U6-snRNA associated small nuclear ribonucleoprotein [Encephalitozoon cuniculi]KMV66008.1 small nuclear ribonucleoprotein [Encephalitozoon cuniculi EcunIII-L]UYI27707.1 small nuclear ribonucleoprotein [Encephalitozoon cuniculi]CAD25474.1 U6-snRNA ASSOCIATED SMALL NUCLEAR RIBONUCLEOPROTEIN [Encephalitozoon cuniculi GB-M1]